MYQAIIYYDNGNEKVLEAESKLELYKKMGNINPEEAIWELKWTPNKVVISNEIIKNIMGNVERMD